MKKLKTHKLHYSDWQVLSRYENLKIIGHGSQGSVCSAFDSELKICVAIKKLASPFHSKDSAKRTYREMKILHHMDHQNVICLIDLFSSSEDRINFNEVYFVTPLLSCDLSKIISKESMDEDHICFFIYQILRGLKYIHSTGIIHRDLAPKNIAINEDNELRILDFGLSRKKDDFMTGYVVSRYYRAPEIIFKTSHYTNKIDIWSVGCIMAEMLIHRILFKGSDQFDQLRQIMQIADTSHEGFWGEICVEEEKKYFLDTVELLPQIDFHQFFRHFTDDLKAIDLLSKMLVLDPNQRISAIEALSHPYLEFYHDETDESVGEPFMDTLESNSDVDLETWKDGIWDCMNTFVPKIDNLSAKA